MNELARPAPDPWAQWVLHDRHADNPAWAARIHADVNGYVDRLLDLAEPDAGATVVDVGTGEGLLAQRAIARCGPALRVVQTDVSPALLAHARARAAALGIAGQCTFVQAEAEQLAGIADASADLVATRASLAYVADKLTALREFARVLRPGGRVALAEPVFQDEAFAARALRSMVEQSDADASSAGAEVPGLAPIIRGLHAWKSAQYPDTEAAATASAICNYNERDLLRLVQQAGFVDPHLELHIDVRPIEGRSWEDFIASSPHPLAPPLRDILATRLGAGQRELFESVVRGQLERGELTEVERVVYVVARRP